MKTKRLAVMAIALSAGFSANAMENGKNREGNDLDEPGSLLVFPLVATPSVPTTCCGAMNTWMNIANTGTKGVTLECKVITHFDAAGLDFDKSSFEINLTRRQKITWMASWGDESLGIPPIDGKGFVYCYAVENGLETKWNHLIGDATLVTEEGKNAGKYNAIPHQGLYVRGDRELHLDGKEYTAASSRIWFDGRTVVNGKTYGELAVVAIDADFLKSTQREIDINYQCWNRSELPFDRHKHVATFSQQSLGSGTRGTKGPNLNLTKSALLGSPDFLCRADVTKSLVFGQRRGAGKPSPVHAVLIQKEGMYGLSATNVWQEDDKEAKTTIVLDEGDQGDRD